MRSTARALTTLTLAFTIALLMIPVLGTTTGDWRLLPILSGSMTPAFPTGSLVVATPVSLRQLHVGEVIAYQAPVGDHHLIAHRIIRILRPGPNPVLETKGDANRAADPWHLRIAGPTAWVVRAGVPLVGYAAIYAKRALVALLFLVAAVTLAAALLRRIWREPTTATPGERRDGHASRSR